MSKKNTAHFPLAILCPLDLLSKFHRIICHRRQKEIRNMSSKLWLPALSMPFLPGQSKCLLVIHQCMLWISSKKERTDIETLISFQLEWCFSNPSIIPFIFLLFLSLVGPKHIKEQCKLGLVPTDSISLHSFISQKFFHDILSMTFFLLFHFYKHIWMANKMLKSLFLPYTFCSWT